MLNNQRVAILEDDPENRGRWTDLVRMCGGVPVTFTPRAPTLAALELSLRAEKASMIMCDNRLFEHGDYANYYGAEAVAASYRSGRGGVLVTAYESADTELSIREYRRWIPVLLHATELKRTVLELALIQADREAREKIPIAQRVPHRTIMTIKSVSERGSRILVKVVMSQWNPTAEIGFPLNIVPEKMRAHVAPGNMLLAHVNLGAERQEDLFFDQFELPERNVLRRSETLFGGA